MPEAFRRLAPRVRGLLGSRSRRHWANRIPSTFGPPRRAGVRSAFWGDQQFSIIFLQGQRATPSSRLLSPPQAPLQQYILALLVSSFWTTLTLVPREFLMAARQFLCSVALCSAWLAYGAKWVARPRFVTS